MGNKITLTCGQCGKEYEILQSVWYYTRLNRKVQGDFCSKQCYGKWLGKTYGWHHKPIAINPIADSQAIERPGSIGSHGRVREWLQNHSKEVAEYSLAHTQKETMKQFLIGPSAICSALLREGYRDKVPPSYLARRSK